jgi:hypothetical protein
MMMRTIQPVEVVDTLRVEMETMCLHSLRYPVAVETITGLTEAMHVLLAYIPGRDLHNVEVQKAMARAEAAKVQINTWKETTE